MERVIVCNSGKRLTDLLFIFQFCLKPSVYKQHLPKISIKIRPNFPKFFQVFFFSIYQTNTKELRWKFSIFLFSSVSKHSSIQWDAAQVTFSVATFWFISKNWTVCEEFFLNAKRHSSVDVEFTGCSRDESQCYGCKKK